MDWSQAIGLVSSLTIYLFAGRGGTAMCATDLCGWHAVNACLSFAALALSGARGCANAALVVRCTLVLGLLSFVWFMVLQVRVSGTHACDALEGCTSGSGCDPTLYTATVIYLVAAYVGMALALCCTCTMFAFFAGVMSAAVAAEAVAAMEEEEGGTADSGRGQSRAGATAGVGTDEMPYVRWLGKGEQV